MEPIGNVTSGHPLETIWATKLYFTVSGNFVKIVVCSYHPRYQDNVKDIESLEFTTSHCLRNIYETKKKKWAASALKPKKNLLPSST